MIRFRCKCGKVLQTREDHAGRPIKCPACDTVLRVPGNEQVSTTTKKKRATKSRRAAESDAATPRRRRKADAAGSGRPPRRRRPAPPQLEEIEEIEDLVDDSDFAAEDEFGSEDFDDFEEYSAPAMPSVRKKKKKGNGASSGKKKKKKGAAASDDGEGLPPKVMYAMFGVAGLVGVLVLGVVGWSLMSASRSSGANYAVPDKFKNWEHELGTLKSEYPEGPGWLIKGGGGTGGLPPWFRIEHDRQDIDIRITGSVSGSAIGDIATAGGTMPGDLGEDVADELDPVAAVHEFQQMKVAANYDKYEETEPRPIDTGCGEGRICEFTGTSLLSTEYGMRATLLCHQYQFNVICKCPKKRLEEYKPVFERIVTSINRQ